MGRLRRCLARGLACCLAYPALQPVAPPPPCRCAAAITARPQGSSVPPAAEPRPPSSRQAPSCALRAKPRPWPACHILQLAPGMAACTAWASCAPACTLAPAALRRRPSPPTVRPWRLVPARSHAGSSMTPAKRCPALPSQCLFAGVVGLSRGPPRLPATALGGVCVRAPPPAPSPRLLPRHTGAHAVYPQPAPAPWPPCAACPSTS